MWSHKFANKVKNSANILMTDQAIIAFRAIS